MPQLLAAIKELQGKGYRIPDFPEARKTDEERDIRQRYGKCLGSAVNPVLREGNSDRRAPRAVKEYVRKHPHSMGEWSMASRSHVAHMRHGDFYHGEKSMTLDRPRTVRMELVTKSGETIVLKRGATLGEGDIMDSMFMSKKALLDFYEEQMEDARKTGVMFSLHVKATMMKVSHPIVFGHAVKTFYKDAFAKHGSCSTNWASTSTTASSISTTRSRHCRARSARRSFRTCTTAMSTVRSWPWSTPLAASRTSIRPATSSWTPRCPR